MKPRLSKKPSVDSLSGFGADSDVDFLVEFEPDHIPGLITLAGMEIERSDIVGRKADLRTPRESKTSRK